jgi:hypothetical protein
MNERTDDTDWVAAEPVQPPAREADGSVRLPSTLIAAVNSLDDLEAAPLSEHIERYQLIHSGLQDVLSGIEGV